MLTQRLKSLLRAPAHRPLTHQRREKSRELLRVHESRPARCNFASFELEPVIACEDVWQTSSPFQLIWCVDQDDRTELGAFTEPRNDRVSWLKRRAGLFRFDFRDSGTFEP